MRRVDAPPWRLSPPRKKSLWLGSRNMWDVTRVVAHLYTLINLFRKSKNVQGPLPFISASLDGKQQLPSRPLSTLASYWV